VVWGSGGAPGAANGGHSITESLWDCAQLNCFVSLQDGTFGSFQGHVLPEGKTSGLNR
jgi:hypothetical protein